MSQMAADACQLSNRCMFYGLSINLLLEVCMATHAQFSRRGAQDMLKVSRMGGMTIQTLPICKRFMLHEISGNFH